MREINRVLRAYAHSRHTTWDQIIPRLEKIINITEHRSTGISPVELHEDLEYKEDMDPVLIPKWYTSAQGPKPGVREKIRAARETLRRRQDERRVQAEKKGKAPVYQDGSKIWVKMHHKLNKSRQLIKKIHPIYEDPYQIREKIRPNAYLVQDKKDVIGVYNARQLRPHRDPEYKEIGYVCDNSNNEYSSDNNRNFTESDESTKAQLPRVNGQEIKPIKSILKKTDNPKDKNKKRKQRKSVRIKSDIEYHFIDYSPEGQSNDEEPIPRRPEQ